MTQNKRFKNESQDARRRDKHNEVHPWLKAHKNQEKIDQDKKK